MQYSVAERRGVGRYDMNLISGWKDRDVKKGKGFGCRQRR